MKSKPIVKELRVNRRKYFHLTCECRYRSDRFYIFYSVVHEWDKLKKWKGHLKEHHECR